MSIYHIFNHTVSGVEYFFIKILASFGVMVVREVFSLYRRFSYYTEGNSQTFKAKGQHSIKSGTIFDTEVKKDVISGSAYAKGSAPSVTFKDVMASFGLDPQSLPDFFINALK